MKTEAITKIEDGRKVYKGNRYGQVMAPYVAEILKDFCTQNEEFAQAVVQGGSFSECMDAVVKTIRREAISDLDACRAAAEFYFPGSVVEFHMSIHMSKYEAEDAKDMNAGMMLRLEDFL